MRNQLAGIPLLRRWRDASGEPLQQYHDVSYNMGVCRHHIGAVQRLGSPAPLGQTLVEIGPGGNLGNALILIASGARRVYCVDNYRHVDFQSKLTAFYRGLIADILAHPERLPIADPALWDRRQAAQALAEAVTFAGDTVAFSPDRIVYLAPCEAQTMPLPDRSIDVLFSHAVLEHVKHPAAVCREFSRVLRPGGYFSHVIDLRDHFDPLGLAMLRYPAWLWHLMSSNSHGHVNRCRAVHFEQFFNDAGATLLQSQATQMLRDVALIPAVLSKEFADLSLNQLQIIGLSVVGIR
ncbi:class I SAM-dependent methyltransferase [uncultured Thiodictyon sp.]|uniref:class I SAM-dependent methyltransferase n=1 Tax=uncultured Thiodictyon sp. TaxID=1846217 RepID=UPI0025D4C1C2|nr:class I SAM-dependent methyltransferase [uncultured Thiodictyon sp.]